MTTRLPTPREQLFALLGLCLVGVSAPPGRADPPKQEYQPSAGPYCGLYPLYAALHAVGIQARFEQLLDDKYLTSPAGSSLDDLARAARDSGATAEPLGQLTVSALRSCRNPVILHVRRPGRATAYAHWVLFLGVENDRARIIDRPGHVETWAFADLLAYTDGIGLIVSSGPVDTGEVFLGAWGEALAPLGLAVGGLLVLGIGARAFVARRQAPAVGAGRRVVRYALSLSSLIAVATTAALGWHWLAPEGFLHNRRAVGQVAIRHFPPSIGTVTVQELQALVRKPGVTVIDARLPRGYRAGHIPGAINIPVDAPIGDREAALSSIPDSNAIVVYCQGAECEWGEAVATDLASRGFRHVSVFPGGWVEWRQHDRAPR